jgi:hypothetical protein
VDEPKFDLALQRRAPEWSRSPEPSPHARGILVQPFNAATRCEFEPVLEMGRVMNLAQTVDAEKIAGDFAICP